MMRENTKRTIKNVAKLPLAVMAVPLTFAGKLINIRLTEEQREKMRTQDNKIYHFVNSEETVKKIESSQFLKYSNSIISKLLCYGTPGIFAFAGIPSFDDYNKNMLDLKSNNILFYPEKILYAFEIQLTENELNNMKFRPFNDEALKYEGYFIPKNNMKLVEIVGDLKRDENGEPIINSKTKKPEIILRKRTIGEIKKSPFEYIPKSDYLEAMKQLSLENGIAKENQYAKQNLKTMLNSIIIAIFKDGEGALKNVRKNFVSVILGNLQKRWEKREEILLEENITARIERNLTEKGYYSFNPYLDKNFRSAVAEFRRYGLIQLTLKDIIKYFNCSSEGTYLREKYESFDMTKIKNKSMRGINGQSHINRVAFWAVNIAKAEEIITNEKMLDILITASLYNDVERIENYDKPLILKYARRKANKILTEILIHKDGNLYTDEEKKIVQAILLCQLGKDNDIEKELKKYGISEDNMEIVKKLALVLKDADTLDRCSLDSKIFKKVNFDQSCLRYDYSKRLLEASYQLRNLSKEVKDFNSILGYGTRELPKSNYKNKSERRKEFEDYIKVKQYDVQEIVNGKAIQGKEIVEKKLKKMLFKKDDNGTR